MEKVNILIIGAGVIGLAVGKVLSEKYEDILVVDKEDSFGRETSSRNSEVIHSGIYYPQNSHKARLSVRGNDLLYKYSSPNKIPCKKTGKLVVATSPEEFPALDKLYRNGIANNVKGLKIIDKEEANSIEPLIKAEKALYVPSTGIIDTHKLMKTLADEIESNDSFIVYGMNATGIERDAAGYIVSFDNDEKIQCNFLINSAGLYSDKIASMAGLDVKSKDLELHWCKGEYYKTTRIKGIEHLIYPLPDPKGTSLGIHLTINLNDEIRFGPNAYYINSLEYGMDESYKKQFLEAINRYLDIGEEDIHPDDTGIRPKLQAEGEDVQDFYIQEETPNGLPQMINLIGIESPGLTAALAIGEYVAELAERVTNG